MRRKLKHTRMYVSRGPSKISPSTRRGLTKPLDNLENRDTEKQQIGPLNMSSPKPVFNHNQNHMNGKRMGMQRMNSGPQESSFPQQEELAQYLLDSWNKVNRELEQNKDRSPTVYREKQQNPALLNFQAFDLAQYWGQRQLQRCGVPGSS